MKILYLISSSILTNLVIYSAKCTPKDTFNITIFETSQKFKNRDSLTIDAYAVGFIESEYVIEIKKIINRSTGENVKESKFIWCFKYKNDFYVNLGYCNDISMNSFFVKLDIIGHYCMASLPDYKFIPPSASNIFRYNNGTFGILAGNMSDWAFHGKSVWKYDSKKKCPILLTDLSEKEYRNFSWLRNESALLNLVTKKDLKKIMKKNNMNITKPTNVKDVEAIIIEINEKYEKD